jgi:hypothetical protein
MPVPHGIATLPHGQELACEIQLVLVLARKIISATWETLKSDGLSFAVAVRVCPLLFLSTSGHLSSRQAKRASISEH